MLIVLGCTAGADDAGPAPFPIDLRSRSLAWGRVQAWWFWLAFLGLNALSLHAEVSKEYQVKAAFMYNFTKFVEWPPQRFADRSAPIVIGVLGQNPFDDALENIVRGRTVNGRKIVVRAVSSADEMRTAHLVFVGAAAAGPADSFASSLAASGTVTVGETMASTRSHGVIAFTLVNLIRNAKYACDESGRADKRITLEIAADERRVTIRVIDNGVGIPPENLTRIFNHGFTTRATGHGFGLHSGALIAQELGGALFASSDGPGKGATFTVELPYRPGNKIT